MAFLFEKLEVYKKSLKIAEEILDLTREAPKGTYSLVDQLRRAACSVPANLAEGNSRFHIGDRRQFFWIARGSANECIMNSVPG